MSSGMEVETETETKTSEETTTTQSTSAAAAAASEAKANLGSETLTATVPAGGKNANETEKSQKTDEKQPPFSAETECRRDDDGSNNNTEKNGRKNTTTTEKEKPSSDVARGDVAPKPKPKLKALLSPKKTPKPAESMDTDEQETADSRGEGEEKEESPKDKDQAKNDVETAAGQQQQQQQQQQRQQQPAAAEKITNLRSETTSEEKLSETPEEFVASADEAAARARIAFALGICQQYAYGVHRAVKKARSLYEEAWESGLSIAGVKLAECWLYGNGGPKDLETASSLLAEVTEKSEASGLYLAGVLCSCVGWKDKAYSMYKKAAKLEHPRAAYNLGVLMGPGPQGEGGYRDAKGSAEMYETAKEGNDVRGIYNLSICYQKGHGVKRDQKRAVELLRRAADMGHVKAMYNLALHLCSSSGKGGTEAETETESGAKNKSEDDDNNNNSGQEGHLKEAIKLYKKAAQNGHVNAMYNLGYLLHTRAAETEDEEENQLEAYRWYKRAAEQGNARAFYNMAVMYAEGTVANGKDLRKAKMLFRTAAQCSPPSDDSEQQH